MPAAPMDQPAATLATKADIALSLNHPTLSLDEEEVERAAKNQHTRRLDEQRPDPIHRDDHLHDEGQS